MSLISLSSCQCASVCVHFCLDFYVFCMFEKLHSRVEPREIRGNTNKKTSLIEIEHETTPTEMFVLSMLCILFSALIRVHVQLDVCQQS